MAKTLNQKLIVEHLLHGTFADKICLVCLAPLKINNYEDIFTLISKKNKSYSIADILETLCQVTLQASDHYNICLDCFTAASSAYKFYLTVKHSQKIQHYYTDAILTNTDDLIIEKTDPKKIVCIQLPLYTPDIEEFDFNYEGVGDNQCAGEIEPQNNANNDDDDIIMCVENGKASYFKSKDGSLQEFGDVKNSEDETSEKKNKRKRIPMADINCPHCSVKYRFVAKLKEHMKSAHNIDIFYCRICKTIFETRQEYDEHVLSHPGQYQCSQCNVIYKKKHKLQLHLEWHARTRDVVQTDNANICEVCGELLEDEESLQEHYSLKHLKKFTCYYCGRLYKLQASLDAHIAKHERILNKSDENNTIKKEQLETKIDGEKSFMCQTCGKSFRQERTLRWHQRLHSNERPYICKVCGRGFVSGGRRAQHALCAHSRPARRCPLCPALFHLASMVNTHLKKVHLKTSKRKNRSSRFKNVFWKTQPVPIQELSVAIQNEVFELQSSQNSNDMEKQYENHNPS